MTSSKLHGVIAAIATAVDDSGEPDCARSVLPSSGYRRCTTSTPPTTPCTMPTTTPGRAPRHSCVHSSAPARAGDAIVRAAAAVARGGLHCHRDTG